VHIDSDNGIVTVDELVQTLRSAEQLTFAVRIRGRPPLGELSATLTIRPAEGQRFVRVAVSGHVVPRITVSPSTLYFENDASASQILKRYIVVRRTDGQPVNRFIGSSVPLGMQVAYDGAHNSSAANCRLLVTLNPTLFKRDLNESKLLIRLEGEKDPVIVKLMVFLSQKQEGQ